MALAIGVLALCVTPGASATAPRPLVVLPPATAGTQPPGPSAAPAPPRAQFHPAEVLRSASAAVAGLVIGTIERLVAAAERIP